MGGEPAQALSVRAAAAECPAGICRDGIGGELTWEQAAERATTLARRLARAGIGDDPRPVGLWGGASPAHLVALHALLEMGCAVAPVHPRWSRGETADFLAETGCRWLLDRHFDDLDPAPAPRSLDPTGGTGEPGPRASVGGFLLRTSGTSGRAKVACLSLAALAASAEASRRRLGWVDGDRWLLALPMAHVGGLSIVTRCLHGRRTVVIDPHPSFDPARFVDGVRRYRVSLVSVVPTMLRRLVDGRHSCPPTVRLVLVGGARCPPTLLAAAGELGWPTIATYGMTEACSQVATQEPALAGRGEPGVGHPLDGFETRIVDDEGAPVSSGAASGALEVRGPSLFDGYLGVPRDPEEWFTTGDRAHLAADGSLVIEGRCDDLIISGGENVAPSEVEAVLESHPEVASVCVVGIPDREWGQLVGAVVVVADRRLEAPEGWDDFLRSELATFRRPRRVRFVRELPVTSGGKIDRRACADLLAGSR